MLANESMYFEKQIGRLNRGIDTLFELFFSIQPVGIYAN